MSAAAALLVDASPFGARCARLEDDAAAAFGFADAAAGGVADRLFLCRVTAVHARLDAAFVDLGLDRPALLTARDARPVLEGEAGAPLARRLAEGRRLVVQGVREARDGKGGRVTADVGLAGFGLVFRPRGEGVEASRRLSPEARAGLTRRGGALGLAGFTLRAAALDAPDDALRAEAEVLRDRWRRVVEAAREAKRTGPLEDADPPVARLLRDHLAPDVATVAACPAALPACRTTLARRPNAPAVVACGNAAARIDAELEAALEPVMPLPGGGRLIVETTSACSTIDVDSGGGDPAAVNRAAARAIGREVRRRELAGTIVVDFVGAPAGAERERLLGALRAGLAGDPRPVRVVPMAGLGLVALARRRHGPSLAERLTHAGPAARRPGLRWQAERLFRALETARPPARSVRLAADLAAYLDREARAEWTEAARRLGGAPALRTVPALAEGTFELETRR